jgi:hypothetical protein
VLQWMRHNMFLRYPQSYPSQIGATPVSTAILSSLAVTPAPTITATSTTASTGQAPGGIIGRPGGYFQGIPRQRPRTHRGGAGVDQDCVRLIYPPSLAKQPFQAPPHPPRGIGELGAGVRECGYTPLLGAAKFFAENSRGTRLSAACRLTPTIARRTNYVAPWRGVIQSFLLSQFQIVLARLHSLSSTPL